MSSTDEPSHLNPQPPPRWLAEAKRRFPDADPSALTSVLRMIGLGRRITALVGRHLRNIGLTEARFTLVMILYGMEWDSAVATPSDLAERAGIGRAAMTQMLEGLVKARWIERRPHAEDRRKIVIALSRRGRRRLEAFLPEHYARLRKLMATLDEADRARLMHLFDQIETGIKTVQSPERSER